MIPQTQGGGLYATGYIVTSVAVKTADSDALYERQILACFTNGRYCRALQNEGSGVFYTRQILTYLTYYTPAISDAVWSLFGALFCGQCDEKINDNLHTFEKVYTDGDILT